MLCKSWKITLSESSICDFSSSNPDEAGCKNELHRARLWKPEKLLSKITLIISMIDDQSIRPMKW